MITELVEAMLHAHMGIVDVWTGRHANALRTALRLTNEGFADHLGIATRTVAKWNAHPDLVPVPELQRVLDTALTQAAETVQLRFALLMGRLPANHNTDENADVSSDQPRNLRPVSPGVVNRTKQPCKNDSPAIRGEVGELMRRLMAERHLSLRKLSAITFYDVSYLSRIKNGEKPLSVNVAAILDDALGANGKFTALASGEQDSIPASVR